MNVWLPEVPALEKIVRAGVVYVFLLGVFRLIGKRQVAQMTPFDLIVLLIISNVLQNSMIGPDNSILGGLIGAVTIVTGNWLVGRMAYGNRSFEQAIEGVPTLVVNHGCIVESALRKELLSREDLLSNLRSQGIFDVGEVRAAVLEPSGKLSVMRYSEGAGERGSST